MVESFADEPIGLGLGSDERRYLSRTARDKQWTAGPPRRGFPRAEAAKWFDLRDQ
jgi:hypothetical protein